MAALCGAGDRLHAEIDVAAANAERLAGEWGPDGPDDALPKQLARAMHGTVPQIAGAGLTAPIAYRWKTQINENAKAPSFAGELPELDHNEIAGWAGAELGPFSAVFLDDSDLHPRTRQRIELARALIQADAAATLRVETIGRPGPTPYLTGAAGRSRVGLPCGAVRRRSHPGGDDRPAQGRSAHG